MQFSLIVPSRPFTCEIKEVNDSFCFFDLQVIVPLITCAKGKGVSKTKTAKRIFLCTKMFLTRFMFQNPSFSNLTHVNCISISTRISAKFAYQYVCIFFSSHESLISDSFAIKLNSFACCSNCLSLASC